MLVVGAVLAGSSGVMRAAKFIICRVSAEGNLMRRWLSEVNDVASARELSELFGDES